MITRMKGVCVRKREDRIYLEAGNFVYEVFVPCTVGLRVEEGVPVELVVYDYFHIEQTKGYPVLIGFLSELEKEFFEKFIGVSGIGPKAALKAFSKSISDIAQAIDGGDIDFLKSLPGIGLQRAKNILATLQGKMGHFVLINDRVMSKEPTVEKKRQQLIHDALSVLEGLQYKRKEAQQMIDRALLSNNALSTVEELLNEIYKKNIGAHSRYGT